MDQTQLLQQLTQVFQQGLTLLQSAQQDGGMDMGSGGDMPNDAPDDMPADGDGELPPGGDDMAGDTPDDMSAGDDGMGGGDSLHDRVSQLEDHTGLAKSADATSLRDRVDALEADLLGTVYEGPMVARIGQLEKAAGVGEAKPPAAAAEAADVDEAPDEIPLDLLIKTAVQEGAKQAIEQYKLALQQDLPDTQLPSPAEMRKSANGERASSGRRAQPSVVQSDEALVKAANQWGMGADLDAPVGFGEALQVMYEAQQSGMFIESDD